MAVKGGRSIEAEMPAAGDVVTYFRLKSRVLTSYIVARAIDSRVIYILGIELSSIKQTRYVLTIQLVH